MRYVTRSHLELTDSDREYLDRISKQLNRFLQLSNHNGIFLGRFLSALYMEALNLGYQRLETSEETTLPTDRIPEVVGDAITDTVVDESGIGEDVLRDQSCTPRKDSDDPSHLPETSLFDMDFGD